VLDAQPQEIVVIPQGVRLRLKLFVGAVRCGAVRCGAVRGYLCGNNGALSKLCGRNSGVGGATSLYLACQTR